MMKLFKKQVKKNKNKIINIKKLSKLLRKIIN